MVKNKPGFNNSYKHRQYSKPEQYVDQVMERIHQSAMDYSLQQDDPHNFDAICLSGIRTEDNDGNHIDANDAILSGEKLQIKIKPIGTPAGKVLPDFTKIKDVSFLNFSLSTLDENYTAESDYLHTSMDSLEFGQIVKCRYLSKNPVKIMFSKPVGDPEFYPGYKELSTMEGLQSTAQLFDGGQSLMGNSTDGIDPRFPPREWVYVGSNQNYLNQKLQNGNLPSDLISTPSGQALGKHKPTILAELISGYVSMAVEFRKKFPNKKLSGWGYRPYSRQLSIKLEKPNLAAKPGTSGHGWGQAIDIHFYVDGASEYSSLQYSGEEYKWLAANSKKYGWYNPAWASQGGSKEEPWHWESTKTLFKKG